MTGGDDSQWAGPGRTPRRPGRAGSDDVLEQGSREPPGRPPRTAIMLGAAGLLAGLVVGYLAGHAQASHTTTAPVTAPAPAGSPHRVGAEFPEGGPPLGGPDSLVQTGSQCATQVGRHRLQLGVQVTNQSATVLTLNRVVAEEPLGGLTVTGQAWGTCGELRSADAAPSRVLGPETSTWFTVTLRVLVRCPGAFPVNFSVGFNQHGRNLRTQLPGFVDLGHVPYTGCPVSG